MAAGRLMHAGRLEEAIALQRRAVTLSPVSPVYRNNLVFILWRAGRAAEALDELKTLQAVMPTDANLHAGLKADLLIMERRYKEALALVRDLPAGVIRDSRLALSHQALEANEGADAAVSRLLGSMEDDAPYHLAEVLAWQGKTEEALRWLYRAGDEKTLSSLRTRERLRINRKLLSPFLAPLRQHPQWLALLAATQPDLAVRESWQLAVTAR